MTARRGGRERTYYLHVFSLRATWTVFYLGRFNFNFKNNRSKNTLYTHARAEGLGRRSYPTLPLAADIWFSSIVGLTVVLATLFSCSDGCPIRTVRGLNEVKSKGGWGARCYSPQLFIWLGIRFSGFTPIVQYQARQVIRVGATVLFFARVVGLHDPTI